MRRLAPLLLLAGCITTDRPGYYVARPPVDTSPTPLSAISAAQVEWNGIEEAADLAPSFQAQLDAAQVFAPPAAGGPDLALQGSVGSFCQPQTVFAERFPCHDHDSFGMSGMNVLLSLVTLGVWPVSTLLGVPSDWGIARAVLMVRAVDPQTGVILASFSSDVVEESDVAGIYYRGNPLARTLDVAGAKLIAQMREQAPVLAERTKVLQQWTRSALDRPAESERLIREALDAPDAALRARAVRALAPGMTSAGTLPGLVRRAIDEDPIVRALAVRALAARPDEPSARAALEVLTQDRSDDVRSRALDALRRQAFAAMAAATTEPLSSLILRLDELERARPALEALEKLGPRARPAIDAIILRLELSDNATRVLAARALGAMETGDPRVRNMLERLAKDGIREASLALAQLPAADAPAAVERPAPPVTVPVESASPIVAVFAVDAAMLKPGERTTMTDLLTSYLTSVGRYRTVPRAEIQRALDGAKAASYRACVDEACQIELGKELAAEKVVHTKVARDKKECVTTATLYDLRTNAAERAGVARSACTLSALSRATEELARALQR